VPESSAIGEHLGEVACVFLKLGTIGFGGPVAHVAMMRDEVVRREWVSQQRHHLLVIDTSRAVRSSRAARRGDSTAALVVQKSSVRRAWGGPSLRTWR